MAPDPKDRSFLGEFEMMVMLAILRCRDQAFAIDVLHELDERAGRRVSRGALYKTLERLRDKRLITWKVEGSTPERGGHPRRRFKTTAAGVRALRVSQHALWRLGQGLEDVLGEAPR